MKRPKNGSCFVSVSTVSSVCTFGASVRRRNQELQKDTTSREREKRPKIIDAQTGKTRHTRQYRVCPLLIFFPFVVCRCLTHVSPVTRNRHHLWSLSSSNFALVSHFLCIFFSFSTSSKEEEEEFRKKQKNLRNSPRGSMQNQIVRSCFASSPILQIVYQRQKPKSAP